MSAELADRGGRTPSSSRRPGTRGRRRRRRSPRGRSRRRAGSAVAIAWRDHSIERVRARFSRRRARRAGGVASPGGGARSERDPCRGARRGLAAEGDAARRARRRPRRGRLADADPGGRLGRRHPGRAPGLDRRGRGRGRDRQGGLGRARARRRSPTRRASSTPRPLAGAAACPGEILARWRDGAGRRSREALRALPRRPEDAVVRPADERRPRWRPPGSWRPGRTPSTSPTALGVDARADRPGPARRPPRRAHPRLRLRRARARAAGRGVPGRADRAVRRAVDVGPGGRRADGDRLGVRLLPAGHPAACTAPTPTWSPSGADADRVARHRAGVRRAARATGREPSHELTCCGSATAPASTATGSPRCARCSRAATLDVLTGDYLAELTMLILGRDQLKDPSLGYARTFVRQVEDCLGARAGAGVRIVANAGGLNPAGLAARLREVAAGSGLDAARSRTSRATTSRRAPPSSGFGGRAHRQRLPRRLRHRRRARGGRRRRGHRPGHRRLARRRAGDRAASAGRPTSYDELAGAVVAGHVHRVRHPGHRRQLLRLPRPAARRAGRSGFPLAEIAADGSCVITKHAGTGGAVGFSCQPRKSFFHSHLHPSLVLKSYEMEPSRASAGWTTSRAGRKFLRRSRHDAPGQKGCTRHWGPHFLPLL